MNKPVETIHFDGVCPFLMCLETGPHDHPICPKCGAVRYGNIGCPECRAHHPELAKFYKDTGIDKVDNTQQGSG
jgi:hypothetical protein